MGLKSFVPSSRTLPGHRRREDNALRELNLSSLMIKFNPKYDPSVDMTIPVCLYVEKCPELTASYA
jgi:hypothetical protein